MKIIFTQIFSKIIVHQGFSILIVFLSMFVGSKTFGQTANNYIFSSAAGAIINPPDLNADGNADYTAIIANGNDDAASAVQNIGFTFYYEGTAYTQFSANSNGLVRLGGTVVGTSFTNDIASASNQPKFMPLWDDLNTGTGNVRTGVSGTAPNRICIIDFRLANCGFLCESTFWNFRYQVRLYESSNVIEFYYHTNTNSGTVNPASASVGIGGVTSTNFISVSPAATPTSSTTTANNSVTTWPGNSTLYTFTPCSQTPGIITPSASGYTANAYSWADPGVANVMFVCPGTTVTFTRSGGTGTGDRYYWLTDGTNGIVDWNIIPGQVRTSPITQTFNSPGIYYLYHFPANCASGFDWNQFARAIIYVESVYSSGYSADQTICYNSTPTQMQGGSVASYYYTNFNYLWQQSTDNGVSWSNAGGTNNQANYTPNSNLTQTTLYKRITNLTQCSGNSQSQSEGKDVTWAWTTGVASTYPTADANDVFTWGESINKNSWSGVDGWGANAAAAISTESITNNGGYVEAIMQWNNRNAMMGLSDNNQVAEWTSIKYAINPRADGQLEVYESGVSRGIVGTYVANDRLRVAVENNQVKYYKNSTLLYTSTVAPTFPLFVDVSINSVNGGFKDLRIVNPIKVTVTPQLTPPTITNISNP
jgi:hypothetical protein